jgi:hypothetical protein
MGHLHARCHRERITFQDAAGRRVFGTLFARFSGMSLCASCGLQLIGDADLCPHHHCVYGDGWAVANRIMCDFFHRKKIPPRLSRADRDDEFWAHTGEAA